MEQPENNNGKNENSEKNIIKKLFSFFYPAGEAADETGRSDDIEDTAADNGQQTDFTKDLLLTVSPSPHIRSGNTTSGVMFDVIIALTPAIIWAVFMFGMRALTLTVISVLSCVLFELWYQLLMKRPVMIGDLSAVVTGILIAMNLPVSASLWVPVAAAFFAIVIVKQLFGGIGKNIVNPAIAARVFIFSSWTSEISVIPAISERFSWSAVSVDAVASATPLSALKSGTLPNIPIFDLLIGNHSGVIGEISALLLLAGGFYLLVRRVITWHIPAAFIGTVAAVSFFFPAYPSPFEFTVYELLSGGLILGAVFMATDYTTSPITRTGKLIYGVGCGLITVFIRYFGGYSEGASFGIMIMNLFVWYIDRFTKPVRFGGKNADAKK